MGTLGVGVDFFLGGVGLGLAVAGEGLAGEGVGLAMAGEVILACSSACVRRSERD